MSRTIKLPYGAGTRSVSLPDEWCVTVYRPSNQDRSESMVSRQEMDHHVEQQVTPLLDSMPADAFSDPVVAIPDHTRDAAQAPFIESIWTTLKNRYPENSSRSLTILIATGRHRPPSKKQMEDLVPGSVRSQSGVQVGVHDAFKPAELTETGIRIDRTPIRIQRRAFSASALMLYGQVKYHYLAGYGGGPKMLCPGLGGDASITAVHRRTMPENNSRKTTAEIGPGQYEKNPMQEAIRTIFEGVDTRQENLYGVQFVREPGGTISGLHAGSVIDSHRRAIKSYRDEHEFQIDNSPDVLVLSPGGSPSDVDLIQSHKALQHTRELYGPETEVVLFAECPDGYGSEDIKPWLMEESIDVIREKLNRSFEVYGRTALALRTLAENTRLSVVTEMDSALLMKTGIRVYASSDEFLDDLRARYEDPPRVLVLPEASSFLYRCLDGDN